MQSNESNAGAIPQFRAWLADWGNALSVLVGLYAIAYLAAMGIAPESTWAHVFRAVAFIPMNAAAALLAFRASQRPDTDARIRRALKYLGIAFTSVILGNVTAFYLKFIENGNPLSAWTNILYFGMYVMGLAGWLSFPLARRVSNEYRKFLLDAVTVVVAGGLAIWYLVIIPTRTFELDGMWGTFFGLAYPIASMLLLLGVVTVFLRRPAQQDPGASTLLLAGFLLYIFSDLANDLTILQEGWGKVSWTDATYACAYLVIISAFARYYWKPPVVSGKEDGKARSQPFTYLPVHGSRAELCSAQRRRRAALAGADERAGGGWHSHHGARRRSPDRCGARERTPAVRAVHSRERGAVRGAGAAFVRRDHDRRSRHHRAVRESHDRARSSATCRRSSKGSGSPSWCTRTMFRARSASSCRCCPVAR